MKPRALDLFCGAGGATRGLQMAGFYVVGVDIKPQPRYCGDEFIQANAMTFPLDGYDFIWASPPCQAYSRATAWCGSRKDHPDLIALVRNRLQEAGTPFVIENVQEARGLLRNPIRLCGSIFGLRVRRHRYFEAPTLPLILVQPCQHHRTDFAHDHGFKQSEADYRDAMGCHWMNVLEAREAIPPAYSQFIGERIMAAVACGKGGG